MCRIHPDVELFGQLRKLIIFVQTIQMIHMKHIFLLVAVILLIGTNLHAQQQPPPTDQIILKLKKEPSKKLLCKHRGTGNRKVDAISEKYKVLLVKKVAMGRQSGAFMYVLKCPKGTDIQELIQAYLRSGEVEFAEPDGIGQGGGAQGLVPNDPFYKRQWGLNNNGTFSLAPALAGADVEMEKAWELETGDSSIIVCVLDGGAKLDHPEFAGRIWKNTAEIPGNNIDDDGNFYIDDVQGWDFAFSDNTPEDGLGHGTNVAGIIGANANNVRGYAGVDWACKLMILKGINNDNFGYYSWWIEGIYYAADHGARVINMSLGGSTYSSAMQQAVNYARNKQVVVVASMMNLNSDAVYYPAGLNGVIAVGSTDPDDSRTNPFFWSATSGSSFGNHISVTAPGNYIYGLSHQSNTNYNSYWGGTSQAAPLVSGLAALLLAQNPQRSPDDIKAILQQTAEDQVGDPAEDTPGWDKYYGFGRVNAFRALSQLVDAPEAGEGVQRLSIAPNPFNNSTTLRWEQPVSDALVLLCDAFGRECRRITSVFGQSAVLYREDLPAGIYVVSVIENGQQIAVAKVVVSG